MTYKELKKIAETHIKAGDNIPSNAFLLLSRLHLDFKNEEQCRNVYKEGLNPLYNAPAFYDKNKKIIYFNSKSKYWNFYIFHEIAHYLLGHESNSAQNETDANMLACILTAPEENLPSNLKTARDLSCLCNIPIDRAEEYWQEIKHKRVSKAPLLFIAVIALICVYIFYKTPDIRSVSGAVNIENKTVYITKSGRKYHKKDCFYIRKSSSITEINVNEAKSLGYTPCSVCIGE